MNDGYMRAGNGMTDVERLREEVYEEARKGKAYEKMTSGHHNPWLEDAFGEKRDESSTRTTEEKLGNLGRGAMDAYSGEYEAPSSGVIASGGSGIIASGRPGVIASGGSSENLKTNETRWAHETTNPFAERQVNFAERQVNFGEILPSDGQAVAARWGSPKSSRNSFDKGNQLTDADLETVLDAVQTTDDKGLNKAGYEVIRRLEKKLDETGDVAEFFEGCRMLMTKNLRNSYANRRDFLKNLDKAV